MTVFVLFSQQRSGASAVTSYISKHPEIVNVHEILNPYNTEQEDNFFGYWLANDPAQMMASGKSPSELFVEFVKSREEKYVGRNILFDIKLNNIHHVLNYWEEPAGFSDARLPWLMGYFQRTGTPVVYLHRANHFERFVSARIAELTGVYRTNKPNTVNARMELNIDDLADYVCKSELAHEAFLGYLAKFGRVLTLSYDEIFVGSRMTGQSKSGLGQFMGFDAKYEVEPYYIKQSPPRLQKVVKNYDELCSELTRLGMEHYVLD